MESPKLKFFFYLGLSITISLLGFWILILPFYQYRSSIYQKTDRELLTITGVLIDEPAYWTTNGKQSKTTLRIELNSYPGAFFDNSYEFLDATDYSGILRDIRFNDTLSLKVDSIEFEERFMKRADLPAVKRAFNSKYYFSFYSLIYAKKEYVKREEIYNYAVIRRNKALIGSILIGTIFIAAGYWIFHQFRTKKY